MADKDANHQERMTQLAAEANVPPLPQASLAPLDIPLPEIIGSDPDAVLTNMANGVAKKMGLDTHDIPLKATYIDMDRLQIEKSTLIDAGTKAALYNSIDVFRPMVENMTLGQMDWAIAHEIGHMQQPDNLSPREKELDADYRAAKALGAQRSIDTLEKIGQLSPMNYVPNPKNVHPSILEREVAITQKFPHESVEIIPTSPASVPNTLSLNDTKRER